MRTVDRSNLESLFLLERPKLPLLPLEKPEEPPEAKEELQQYLKPSPVFVEARDQLDSLPNSTPTLLLEDQSSELRLEETSMTELLPSWNRV